MTAGGALMQQWRLRLAAFGTICLIAVVAVLAADTDPFVGTWKLNLAKSKFDGPAPKSSVVTITTVGDKRKVAVHTVPAEGPDTNTESTTAEDGKDYPMKGSMTVDTVAVTKINVRALQRKDKKGGKIVATLRASVSADGKRLTVNQRGTNILGKAYNNTLVYDRVGGTE